MFMICSIFSGQTYGAHHMLTKKQFELLKFIDIHINEHGVSPSFDEMKDALNLKSKSGIHRLITALEERGFLARLAHRARALATLPRASQRPTRACWLARPDLRFCGARGKTSR